MAGLNWDKKQDKKSTIANSFIPFLFGVPVSFFSNGKYLTILFFVVSFRRKNSSSLEKFQMRIRKRELYPKDDKYIDRVITDMVKLPILHVGKLIHEWELVYWLYVIYQRTL